MASLIIFTVSLVFSSVVAAPFTIDDATMLRNGQAAQILNAEFLSLSASSSCTTGQTACIGGAYATCTPTISNTTSFAANITIGSNTTSTTAGIWVLESCPSDQQCFALPFVRSDGTYVSCVSQSDATTFIAATGATGGLIATELPLNATLVLPLFNATDIPTATNLTSTSSSSNCTSSDQSTTDTAGPNSTSSDSDSTCSSSISSAGNSTTTVTITLPATGTATVPSVTRTLNASEASSLLASLTANGGSVITVIPAPTSTGGVGNASASDADVASASVTASASASNAVNIVSSAIIQLTPKATTTVSSS